MSLSLEHNLAYIAGCSSVTTSEVATDFLPDNRLIGLAQNLGAKPLSYARRLCDGGPVCSGSARLGSVLRRRVSTVGILNEHSVPLLRAYHGCERRYKSRIFYCCGLQNGKRSSQHGALRLCAKRSLGISKRGAIFHRLNSMATGDRLQHDHRSGL